jgi:alpha-tubulin suppressor-like RCC1 family protein
VDAIINTIIEKNKMIFLLAFILIFTACNEMSANPVLEHYNAYVSPEIEIISIAAGGAQSYAIKPDGSLWVWGYNQQGFLGTRFSESRHSPVKIMEDVVAVSAGALHTLAIQSDGSLWAWGRNIFGQLGNGTTEDSFDPIRIMDDVLAVSAGGSFSMAIKTDGSLWTWGANGLGQLGDGTHTCRYVPVKVMDGVTAVSAGGTHGMAVKNDGSLWTWGWQKFGQLGDGITYGEDRITIARPVPVKIMDDVVAVSAGEKQSMAVGADGSLWAWGRNAFNLLGEHIDEDELDEYYELKDQPIPVKIMEDVVAVSVDGSWHKMVIKTDGSLWAWGWNMSGELGFGDFTEDGGINPFWQNTPVKIMDDVIAVSTGRDTSEGIGSGGSHTMAIRSDGSLWTWGSNTHGQLGLGFVAEGWADRGISEPMQVMDAVMLPSRK